MEINLQQFGATLTIGVFVCSMPFISFYLLCRSFEGIRFDIKNKSTGLFKNKKVELILVLILSFAVGIVVTSFSDIGCEYLPPVDVGSPWNKIFPFFHSDEMLKAEVLFAPDEMFKKDNGKPYRELCLKRGFASEYAKSRNILKGNSIFQYLQTDSGTY